MAQTSDVRARHVCTEQRCCCVHRYLVLLAVCLDERSGLRLLGKPLRTRHYLGTCSLLLPAPWTHGGVFPISHAVAHVFHSLVLYCDCGLCGWQARKDLYDDYDVEVRASQTNERAFVVPRFGVCGSLAGGCESSLLLFCV